MYSVSQSHWPVNLLIEIINKGNYLVNLTNNASILNFSS